MLDMASKEIIPAVIRYAREVADSLNSVKAAGCDYSVQEELLRSVSEKLREAQDAYQNLKKRSGEAAELAEGEEQARFCHDTVVPAMNALRAPVDELEMMVDKKVWPMPSYAELLFEV